MRAVIQRVNFAKLKIDNEIHTKIDKGLLVFICVCQDDDEKDLLYTANKMVNMRIFSDNQGRFNLSLKDINGECMIVSQFTLAADTKKGNRPSYFYAKKPQEAQKMYEQFIDIVKGMDIVVQSGVFGANMQIELENNGPVTIYLDSKEKNS